ncbi:hypothetical protein Lal_00024402 [Lupinus albus]|nr:hypothetical protein Lal_00024402 [Lupinus albus]
MASSSRTKKQHANASQKKQPTFSKANPLDLARLLGNYDQCVVFTKHFFRRPLFAPKYGTKVGFGLQCSWEGFSKREIEDCKQKALSETVQNRDILSVENITLEERLLHYLLRYVRKAQPLPYAIIITVILKHFDISIIWETMIELGPRDRKIDMDVIHKMCVFIDPNDWLYKHWNDQSVTPKDNPSTDPPTPNPSSFHIELSSSFVMPTNHLIMVELVFL